MESGKVSGGWQSARVELARQKAGGWGEDRMARLMSCTVRRVCGLPPLSTIDLASLEVWTFSPIGPTHRRRRFYSEQAAA